MPELIDCKWFDGRTANEQTRANVAMVARWQQKALQKNEMPLDSKALEFELDGDLIRVEAGSAVNALEIYQEIFRDEDHYKVEGFSPAGKSTIIDLGANYGFYALQVKRHAPECCLFCLEPNPYVFKFLQLNLQKYHDVKVKNAAAGAEDKRGRFELVRQIPSIAGLTLRQVKRKWLAESMIEEIDMEYLSLRGIYAAAGFDSCDILKIDIEGAEGELLGAAADKDLRRAERIVLERHTSQLRDDIIIRLTAAGFKLVYDQDPECQRHYGNLYFARV